MRHQLAERDIEFEIRHFIEEIGLFFEQAGLPRMAGRILGKLLIANPSQQSLSDLAESLVASKGSVSTMTRLLIQAGLIERVSLPGERRDYFRLKPNAWFQMTKQRMGFVTALHDLAVKGIGLVDDDVPNGADRLIELKELSEFWESELPGLVDRWEDFRRKRNEASDG